MAQRGTQLGGSLLPWTVTSEEGVLPAAAGAAAGVDGAGATTSPPLELSIVDRIAAPGAFMHQCLVFEQPLEAARLRAALARVLTLMPTLACRATQDAVRCVRGRNGAMWPHILGLESQRIACSKLP